MATTLTRPRRPQTDRHRFALAVADAGWYTTENLFREVPSDRASTLLLRCADVRVAWSKGQRPWSWNRPATQSSPGLWHRDLVLPSGWMKKYPRIGMRPIARAIRRWHADRASGEPLALVMTYPYYLHLADRVWPDRLIYFNVDDYRLYWPGVADEVTRLEHRAVRESDLTVCTSLHRTEELRAAVPEAAERIWHLPHGAPSASIPDRPQHLPAQAPADIADLPRPLIGYVGTLEDRIDWSLVAGVAKTNPTASVILVGRAGTDGEASWQLERRECLALPNVHAIGWRGQSTIDAYNRSFDLGLIPYQVDHPFNLASCPTKIMDYMAAGRPVVATNLPECRLYPEQFDVVEPGSFVEAVSTRISAGPDDGRAALRFETARENSCRKVAEKLIDWIKPAR
jgi:teichuronic acid biosynthesis glycosyltransferase TuaH